MKLKKLFLILMMICITTNLFSQTEKQQAEFEKRSTVTVGILQGGGSLVGVDFEVLLSNRIGFQVGAGFIGLGAGLNYHLEPTIRSSYISFQYWNQGIGNSFAQNAIGPNFVYRHKKWFTAQIGLGFPMETGPAMPSDYVKPPVMLMYAIGAYFPF